MDDSDEWFGGYSTSASRAGVTVEKGITIDAIPLPAIRLRLTSEADRPVAVRVVERVPSTMPMENVAFHVDHGASDWRATEDNRLVWRRRVDPGETVETLFGVWLTETREVFSFLEAPDIAAVRRLDGKGDAASWRYEGAATSAVDVIDDDFETAEPALLREMVADLCEQLTGERVAIDTSLGTASRAGVRDLDAPTADGVAELHDSVDDLPAGDRCVVRVATEGGRHGGGGVAVLQELTNAETVLSKRVRPQGGDGEVLDALVVTDHDPGTVADSLAERSQVVGALVAPVGAADVAEDDTEAAEDDETDAERARDDEVPDDPMAEFASLQEEIDTVSTDELERELEEVTLPGAEDREDEIGIDELLAEVGPMEADDADPVADDDQDPTPRAHGAAGDDDTWDSGTDEVAFEDLLADEAADEGVATDAPADDDAQEDDGRTDDAEEWNFGVDPVDADANDAADGETTADADDRADARETAADETDPTPVADEAAPADETDATPGETAVAEGSDPADASAAGQPAGVDPETVERLLDEVETLRSRVADLEETEEEVERLRSRVADLERKADRTERLPGSPRLLEES